MRAIVVLLCMVLLALACEGESLDAQTCDLEECAGFDAEPGTGLP